MIKLKLKYFLFLYILFFPMLQVNAGVCNGYDIDNSSGTCKSISVSVWTPDWLNKRYGSYFLRPGYVASTTNGDAVAFCLDPGLPRSTKELTYIREIDNSDTSGGEGTVGYYDDGVYRMYQYFYNNLLWNLNNGGLSDDNMNQERAYFQNALRVWTYKNKFDYLAPNSAKYEIDAPHFKTCAHYIDSTVSSGTSQSIADCYGNNTHLNNIQKYYDSMAQNYLWVNPLNIETKSSRVTGQDNKKYYRYEFNITFNNGSTKFFDDTYSQGISYRDIQIGNAEFYLDDLSVNGVSCSSSSKCYNYSGNGIVNTGDSRQFIVELSEEQYNEFKNSSEDGTVNVTMHYGYQHPMNIENLYTARYDLTNSYQRMLIIRNYIHKDSITIGKTPEISKCLHNSSGYINSQGNKVSTLAEFMASCGCNSVNRDLLDSNGLEYYNNKCSNSIIEESYTGSVNNCDDNEEYDPANSDTNFSNYSLGYKKVSRINDYCTETCNEDITINDLKGKYTTVAGTYFEFKKYPSLIANKKCVVDIDYNKWITNYRNNLQDLVNKYNDWQEAKMAYESEDSSDKCNPRCCGGYVDGVCTRWCYDTLYKYNYTYEKVYIVNNTDLDTETVRGDETRCGSRINWNVNSKLSAFRNASSSSTSIANLKSDLKTCNNRLFGSKNNITDENFYDFKQQLNYYYYQTYSDKNIGTRKNNERSSYGGINDSEFKVSSQINSEKTGEGSYKNYASLSESGISRESIYTYGNSYSRTVEYDVKYNRPKYEKYVEVSTGKISTTYVENKSIKLGYVYDIDVSAIPKSDNKTYYAFSKLGASDNKIFNHFKDGDEIKRYCTYEITNDIIGCEDGNCDDEGSKLKVVFRIVDPNNIDPNSRFGTGEGFKNWDNDKGKATKAKIENDDTYNPKNLEYSFSLDSATIKAIRNYNSNCDGNECDPIVYSDTKTSYSELECDENGLYCKSKFITTALSDNTIFGKKFALNTNGRSTWKDFTTNEGKYYIDGVKIDID